MSVFAFFLALELEKSENWISRITGRITPLLAKQDNGVQSKNPHGLFSLLNIGLKSPIDVIGTLTVHEEGSHS